MEQIVIACLVIEWGVLVGAILLVRLIDTVRWPLLFTVSPALIVLVGVAIIWIPQTISDPSSRGYAALAASIILLGWVALSVPLSLVMGLVWRVVRARKT